MAKKLFVGNLPYTLDSEGLKTLFSSAGSISDAVVINDKFSGRSKGFGFVEFQDDAEADKAIEEFSGKDVEGRELTVNEARPKAE